MLVKCKEAKNGVKDVCLDQVTADNFICPQGQEHIYHCLIERVRWKADAPASGPIKLSKPRYMPFYQKVFENGGKENLISQGWSITMLHDPHVWERKVQEEKEKAEEAKRKAEEAGEGKTSKGKK